MKFYIPTIFAIIIISVMLTAIFISKPKNSIEIISGNVKVTNESSLVSNSTSNSEASSSSSYSAAEISQNTSESSLSQTQTTQTITYTLKLNNSKLYVYSSEKTDPISSYTISEKMLPKSDLELLYQGVTVSTQGELQKLIEDYTS